FERETFVDEVMLAPSERAVMDVLFETKGVARLEHRTPDRVYDLGSISVGKRVSSDAGAEFDVLRTDSELSKERRSVSADIARSPDKTLAFFSRMPLLYGEKDDKASSYVCPMHPEVTSSEPGTCPKCGMKLMPSAPAPPAALDLDDGDEHAAHQH